jgi:hypothetical protein
MQLRMDGGRRVVGAFDSSVGVAIIALQAQAGSGRRTPQPHRRSRLTVLQAVRSAQNGLTVRPESPAQVEPGLP